MSYAIGVFDLFHIGHVNHLLKAKSFEKKLIVGVCSDELVCETKRQPIIPENQRVELIKALKCVDSVFIYTNLNQVEKLKELKVNTFCIGPEYNRNPHYEETMKFCKDKDIKVQVIERTKGISTTDIIGKCLQTRTSLEQTAHTFWNSFEKYPSYKAPIDKRRNLEVEYLLPHLTHVDSLLDLACGDGALITMLSKKTKIDKLYAYDFSESMLENITNPYITKKVYNVLTNTDPLPKVDVCVCAGLLPFIFSDEDALKVLGKITAKKLLLRAPCSMEDNSILVDGFSQDLKTNYASLYRTVDQVKDLLSKFFTVKNVDRIYPDSIESNYGTKQFYFACYTTRR